MMRYLLFAGEIYYAKGGAHDLMGGYATEQEALTAALALQTTIYEWWHIYDLGTGEVVRASEFAAYDAPGYWAGRGM